MKSCVFNVVPCDNKCGAEMTQSELVAHCLNDCPKRLISCQFCNIKVVFKKLQVIFVKVFFSVFFLLIFYGAGKFCDNSFSEMKKITSMQVFSIS